MEDINKENKYEEYEEEKIKMMILIEDIKKIKKIEELTYDDNITYYIENKEKIIKKYSYDNIKKK